MVTDPGTGKVLAMVSLPTYDPGDLSGVKDVAVFNNNAVSTPYEAGSIIKTLTLAAGIDKNVVQPNSTYNNTDYIRVEDRTISNATKGQTGTITMQDALNYSLNTGMVTVAQRLGDGANITVEARNTMYEYFYNKLGLGKVTGIELANEAQGTVVPPTDPDGGAVRYSNMSFGQGMDVTMVQVCAAFGAVINGGTYYQPTIVTGKVTSDGEFEPSAAKPARSGVIKEDTSDKVREMVYEARNKFYSGQDKPGYYVGGKTGTSQTLEDGLYVDNQTVGTYLGFGGARDEPPKYVIMVQVSGKNMNLVGNRDAMPIFTDISNWMIDYMKLPPKG
jgi:cell division protein FtsI (penicillin-binding protein 3)